MRSARVSVRVADMAYMRQRLFESCEQLVVVIVVRRPSYLHKEDNRTP